MTFSEQYRAAVERETVRRESAFLGLPEKVGPFLLRPFTALDYTTLHMLGSPMVTGKQPEPADVWQMMWHQSVTYSPRSRVRRWFHQWLFIHHRPYSELYTGAHEYIANATIEFASSRGKSGKAYYSWLASVVDMMSSEYGWSRDSIVNMPMCELGQYVKAARKRHDPKAIMFNESDSLWRKAILEQGGVARG